MSIYLGNVGVDEMQRRLGISFPVEIVDFMQSAHQDSAGPLAKGKWHCFDLPFVLMCENKETATKIYEALKPMASQVKEQLMFAIRKGTQE